MSGNGVGRVHGNGLNGASEFYYEAVEGSQNPGGLLLSPAAFINPAQYASVLEGRFKQLQGESPARGTRSACRGASPGGAARAQKPELNALCDPELCEICVVRHCDGDFQGIVTSGRKM